MKILQIESFNFHAVKEILLLLDLLQVINPRKELHVGDGLSEVHFLLLHGARIHIGKLLIRLLIQVFSERSQILLKLSSNLGLTVCKLRFLFIVKLNILKHIINLANNHLGETWAILADCLVEFGGKQLGGALVEHLEQIFLD